MKPVAGWRWRESLYESLRSSAIMQVKQHHCGLSLCSSVALYLFQAQAAWLREGMKQLALAIKCAAAASYRETAKIWRLRHRDING